MIVSRKYKLQIMVMLGFLFFLYSVIHLYGKVDYFEAMFISLVDMFFILWFLTYKYAKNFIIYIYFIYGIITLKLPFIFIVFMYSIEEIMEYLNYRNISIDDVLLANLYILGFDILLVCFLFFFLKKKTIPKWNISRFYWTKSSKVLLISIVLLTAYVSKIYLMKTGVWFFYEMNDLDLRNIPFVGYANILEKLDFLVMLYFVFKYKVGKLTKVDRSVFLFILVVSLLFAIPSTSKGRILTLLVPVFFMSIYARNKLIPIIGIIILLPMLSGFFNTMMYLRTHPASSLGEALSTHEVSSKNSGAIADNKALARIDYQVVLAKAFKTYPAFPNKYKFDYTDNIIGIIPRALWKDKPIIGMDMNKIGYEIGLLQKYDDYTYVGLTPIGIAYYEMGMLGIVFIAIFTAILLSFFAKKLDANYWMGFLLSIMIAFQLARNGTYTNILPSILQVFIVFSILGLLMSNKYSDEKKLRFRK